MGYKDLVQIQNVFWPNMLHSQLHGLKLNYNPFLPSDKLNLNAFVMEIKMTFWTCRCLLAYVASLLLGCIFSKEFGSLGIILEFFKNASRIPILLATGSYPNTLVNTDFFKANFTTVVIR